MRAYPELADLDDESRVVDAWEQRTQRPTDHKEKEADEHYSGKKKAHTLKSQIVVELGTGNVREISPSVPGPVADPPFRPVHRLPGPLPTRAPLNWPRPRPGRPAAPRAGPGDRRDGARYDPDLLRHGELAREAGSAGERTAGKRVSGAWGRVIAWCVSFFRYSCAVGVGIGAACTRARARWPPLYKNVGSARFSVPGAPEL